MELLSKGEKEKQCVPAAEVRRCTWKGNPCSTSDLCFLSPKQAEEVLRKPRLSCYNEIIRVIPVIERIIKGPPKQGHISK